MSYPIHAEWFDRPGWSGFHTPRPGNSDGLHHGFDFYCPEGTPIYATGDGVVKGRGTGFGPTSFGNNTTIWYDGTPIAAATYAHMNALPLNPVGTRVTAETILGYVGHTGNAATVVWNGLRHVHEEILINGRYVDPIAYHGPETNISGGNATPINEPIPVWVEEDDMKVWKLYDGSYIAVDHVNKTYRVIAGTVSTEWNGFKNSEDKGAYYVPIDQAGWADLSRGFTRIW